MDRAWATFRKWGSPRLIAAPMVDASELPFRMLARKYGAQLCYTPMINVGSFVRSKEMRKSVDEDLNDADHPVIVQLCGHDIDLLLETAESVQSRCDAIDLNLGCPQKIAKRGFYGAFLMEDADLVRKIVSTLSARLRVPVTCKIRVFDDEARTIKFAKMLQDSGCQMLVVHGRTKEMIRQESRGVDFEIIKKVKQALDIPVISNGGIETFDDIQECLKITGTDGVMVAEGLLANPGIFSDDKIECERETTMKRFALAFDYLDFAERYPPSMGIVRGHVVKMLYQL